MKGTTVLFFAALTLTACQPKPAPKRMAIPTHTAERKPQVEAVANAKVEMKIEGMMCEMGCARRIQQKLNEAPGVTEAIVNFKAKAATVAFDSTQTDTRALAQVVGAAGPYQVNGVTRL